MGDLSRLRVGSGFDVHRLVSGRRCVIGGVEIPSPVGLLAHSDGDVLVHALMDAMLGVAGKPDIGHRFPPSDPAFKDANSISLLRSVWAEFSKEGWAILNLDCTILAETPKLAPFREKMQAALGDALELQRSRIGIKATTAEKLGALGRAEGVAAQVVVLMVAPESAV